jgi:hypothetical protein
VTKGTRRGQVGDGRAQAIVALALAAISIGVSACTPPTAHHADCEWPPEAASALDVTNRADRDHLRKDAETAEDLAIRYADWHRGHRSGHYAGPDEYRRARDECIARLADSIVRDHRVTIEQVDQARLTRPTLFDPVVLVFYAILYVLVADRTVRWIFRALQPGDSVRATGSILFVSVGVSAMGVAFGDIWSAVAEVIRLGNDHLSYRGYRIPWSNHRLALFIAGVVLFWLVAVRRSVATARVGGRALMPGESGA